MAKTCTITLGGEPYEVRRFNIGQLEDVAELLVNMSPAKVPFGILRLALQECATPKVDDVDSIEAEFDEVKDAALAIMMLAGLKPEIVDPKNPPRPVAPAAT